MNDQGTGRSQDAKFDQTYDVVVIGSGAGGMTAALCAKAQGLSAIVLEKADSYGGTSAVSGGGIWIPCNDQIPGLGGTDSYAEALTYMNYLTAGEVPAARIEAYLRNAPEMVRFLAQRFGVKFAAVKRYPDYFPDKPGGKPGYRTMEPGEFDLASLGALLNQQREAYKSTLLMGRVAMNQVEAHTLFTRGPGWIWLMIKMMAKYWLDFGWRRQSTRDRRGTLGQALVGSLRRALQEQDIPLQLSTGLESLIEDNGRVVGVNLSRNGQRLRIAARRGVVLACGGFESNQQMRDQYLPKPTNSAWTAAPPINHGDGIRAGIALGADLKFMDLTWGTPTMTMPGATSASGLFVERGLPGCVMVNQLGQRFVNEAAPYTEVVYAIQADQAKTGKAVPCWLIFDADYRRKYPMGPMLPGSIQPDSKLPKEWLDSVYYRAESLEALAVKIGVDVHGLNQSVADIAAFSKSGTDTQFGKGNTVFDRYYSDPTCKPNTCLAPIAKAPFYAVRVQPGELGTKGGLVTDEHARVVRADGSRIEGLYAVGNCSAAVMGRTYAGPGATLGPAMTFAYIAARSLAQPQSEPAVQKLDVLSAA